MLFSPRMSLLGLLIGLALGSTEARAGAGQLEELETYFQGLKSGSTIRLDLENGTLVEGKFTTYDEYYGRIWVVPDASAGGLFQGRSVRLSSIRHVDAGPSAPTPSVQQVLEVDY
jgi:hypothetical protein